MGDSSDHNSPAKVRGILIPAAWDRAGRVLSALLAAFDEQNYYIDDSVLFDPWNAYLTLPVTATGTIYQADGQIWIKVYTLDPIEA